MSLGSKKILVVRPDRLGDVVLSLPALVAVRLALPDAQISLIVQPQVALAIEPLLSEYNIRTIAYVQSERFDVRDFDAVLHLVADATLMFRCWKAGISLRVGPLSKLSSFLFLNEGIRQKRSLAQQSEGEYCLNLTRHLLNRLGVAPKEQMPIEIPFEQAAVQSAISKLKSLNLNDENGFVVVHPGMAGSALNVSVQVYCKIIAGLRKKYGLPIVLSVGPSDVDRQYREAITSEDGSVLVLGDLSLPELREVFRRARLVVAPSTGPIHLAHYTGTETLGLYSPVRAHHPRRWAPWGGTGKVNVYGPSLDCPATKTCLGKKCNFFPCMENYNWESEIFG